MSRRGPVMGEPRSDAAPAEAGRMPDRILSRVDLPQPDGPTTATNSPSPTAKEMSSSADTDPVRAAYRLESALTSMTVMITGALLLSRKALSAQAAVDT